MVTNDIEAAVTWFHVISWFTIVPGGLTSQGTSAFAHLDGNFNVSQNESKAHRLQNKLFVKIIKICTSKIVAKMSSRLSPAFLVIQVQH